MDLTPGSFLKRRTRAFREGAPANRPRSQPRYPAAHASSSPFPRREEGPWGSGLLLFLFLTLSLACNLPIQFRTPEPPGPERTPFPTRGTETRTPLPVLSDPVSTPTPPPTFERPTATQPPPTPALSYEPVFEPAACNFFVPPGYNPECGDLVVPENRSRADTAFIRLHVAIFRSRSPNPALDPVVHLAGGPGSSSLDVAGYMFSQGLDAVLNRSDLILFDQRGTGASRPLLDCPEREAITPTLLEQGLVVPESGEAIVDAFRRCRERLLSEGVDLSAHTSAASAADVNDLRLALGYAQINLYGVSYGTRLGLTVMRDYPEAVRSAVLDSLYPPEVHLYNALPYSAGRAFDVFFDRCAADADCSARYPNLEAEFYALVDRLNAEPASVPFSYGGTAYTARLDGGLLLDVLLVGLYNPSVAATMPAMIDQVRQGDYSILRERLALYLDDSGAPGMTMAVQCAEEIPFSRPDAAFVQPASVQPAVTNFFAASVQPLWAVCAGWQPGPLDPRENRPVSSSVPTLILAGEGDPITQPFWGLAASRRLTNSRFFELPGQGHWTTRSSPCALSLALAFWNDPAAELDEACVSN